MNCWECEQLFDAYLDGQLAGSLRLEFEAHRLHCQHCQQSLAMLETVGSVIASDNDAPELAEDFTERVMQQVERGGQARILRLPRRRTWWAAGGLASAAAAVALAFLVPWQSPEPLSATPGMGDSVAPELAEGNLDREHIVRLIAEGVEDRFWEMHAAGNQLSNDLAALAQYLDIAVPADVVAESEKLAENPWTGFWQPALPPEDAELDDTSSSDGLHSI